MSTLRTFIVLAATLGGFAAAPHSANAGPGGWNITLGSGPVWIPPAYETRPRAIVAPAQYETRTRQVWREAVYEDRQVPVQVPPRLEIRQVPRYDARGQFLGYERVEQIVEPARTEWRTERVLVQPARWETVAENVLVQPERTEVVYEQVLVSSGYWRAGGGVRFGYSHDDHRHGRPVHPPAGAIRVRR